jgi:protease I
MATGCWSKPTAARKASDQLAVTPTLGNAGANVVDEEAVTDGNIIPAASPTMPAFTDALIAAIEAKA